MTFEGKRLEPCFKIRAAALMGKLAVLCGDYL